MEKRVEKLDSGIPEIYEYQVDPKYVQDELAKLEETPRWNNLSVDGIKETKVDEQNDCKQKVQDIFANKLRLDEI